jgi:hypothetical protein
MNFMANVPASKKRPTDAPNTYLKPMNEAKLPPIIGPSPLPKEVALWEERNKEGTEHDEVVDEVARALSEDGHKVTCPQ